MADGDRIHQHLALRYQQPYRQLCEGYIQPDEQARNLAERIRRDLKKCHPHLASPFVAIAGQLEIVSQGVKTDAGQLDLREESLRLRQIAARCPQKRDGALLVEAAQSILGEMTNGQIPDRMDEKLGCKFTEKLYQSKFGDVVLTPTQGQGNFPLPQKGQLEAVESHLHSDLNDLGIQFSKSAKEEKPQFRLRPRRKAGKIDDLDTDITDVFKKD